ncbi:MAG TPA: TadE family protein [Candidatus Limnocylindria bacterium]|jgi:hypothetical protein
MAGVVSSHTPRGQTLVELALVLPLAIAALTGIITFGLGVFYTQQVTNAAREAARFAAIHSATAQCPTVSKMDPMPKPGDGYYRCDAPEDLAPDGSPDPWGNMVDAGRSKIFGLPSQAVIIVACWSGYVDDATGAYDAPPPDTVAGISTSWAPCTIDGKDPAAQSESIPCSANLYAGTSDTASNVSEAQGRTVANQVTVFACYEWTPPLAGFLLLPDTITLRGVVSEPIQRQQ